MPNTQRYPMFNVTIPISKTIMLISTNVHYSRSHVSLMFTYTGWKTPGYHNFTIVGRTMQCEESEVMLMYSSNYEDSCPQKRMCTLNYEGSLLSTETCHFTCYQAMDGDFYGHIYSTDPGDMTFCDILLQ